MLGLHSLLDPVKKGTRLPLREGGREKGGREKQQISPAVDFPQVPLYNIVIIIMCMTKLKFESVCFSFNKKQQSLVYC